MMISHIHGPDSLFHLLSAVLSIGNFDGVHVGHQEILRRLSLMASRCQAPSVVMSFAPHPVEILAPERKQERLYSLEDQGRQIQNLTINYQLLVPFNLAISRLTPVEFLQTFVTQPLHIKGLVVGYDFSFGVNKSGNLDFLQEFCKKNNIELEIVPAVRIQAEIVSTTRIRKALEAADLELVRQMLGRAYYVEGLVVKGDGRGNTIGFPTANLQLHNGILPASGVYVGEVTLLKTKKTLKAIANVGVRPTFKNQAMRNMEVHILNFSENLYQETIGFTFNSLLRPEMKFASVTELVAQIKKDIQSIS